MYNNYDMGASQFAGGGFMPSQNAGDQFGAGQGQQKKAPGSQTLRAVTIKQLVRDVANCEDENFKVDGVDVSTVSVVGKIESMTENNTRLLLTINDGTGRVEVTQWLNDDADGGQGKRHDLVQGAYVRVYGSIRSFERKKSINAYSVRLVTDFNETTFHFLQAVFQRLHLTQGMPLPAGMGFGAAPAPGAANYQAPSSTYAQPPAGTPAGAGSGMSPIQTDVMSVYNMPQYRGEVGVDIKQVIEMLRPKGYSPQDVYKTVEFLSNEGHLYVTIDDNHHKSSAF